MPWIKINDAPEGIDSGSRESDSLYRVMVGGRVPICINHDAAVGVIHQLQELFNNGGYFVPEYRRLATREAEDEFIKRRKDSARRLKEATKRFLEGKRSSCQNT